MKKTLKIIQTLAMLIITVMAYSCSNTFSTQNEEDWSFVTFGDLRQGYGVYEKLAVNMGSIRPSPEIAVCLGDIIVDPANEAEWSMFRRLSKPITDKMPMLIVRGNHEENYKAAELSFRKAAGISEPKPLYFSRLVKNKQFIVLDTDVPGEENSIVNEQLRWLKSELDSASNALDISGIFLFMHRPLFRQGRNLGHNQKNAEQLHAIFQNYKKIQAVFAGHDHIFHHHIKDGVRYITSGGAGSPLRHGWGGDYHHFVKISFFEETNTINLKTIGVFNEIIEDWNF